MELTHDVGEAFGDTLKFGVVKKYYVRIFAADVQRAKDFSTIHEPEHPCEVFIITPH
jgi:hypothetical protein